MITIKTYIRSENTFARALVNLELPATIIKKDFVPCLSLGGAIEIFYNGRSLLNIDDFWGLVTVSWSMMLGMIDDFLQAKIGYSEIVECGARFEIMWLSYNQCAFTITSYETETIMVPIDELLKALLAEADMYFTTMKTIFGEEFECDYEIPLLLELKPIVYDTPQSEWWSLVIRSYIHNPCMEIASKNDFQPYVNDSRWIYTRNREGIWKVKHRLTPDTLVGTIYMEYKNKPLTVNMPLGHIDQFAQACIAMIVDIVSHKNVTSMVYGGIEINLTQSTQNSLGVYIACDGNEIQYTTLSKPFLQLLLSTALNILGVVRYEDYYKITIAHYRSIHECRDDLEAKIDLLSS